MIGEAYPASVPGVRRLVYLQQVLGLDLGVALGGRQAGVAEQFLDRAQIAAAAQEMRRETVPQRVRGRGLGEAEHAAQGLHLALHEARAKGAAARADKERPVLGQRIGAGGEIVGDRLVDRRQHRDVALLAALAGDHERFAARRFAARQAQRLGDAQPAAVEQRQDRDVALLLPGASRPQSPARTRGDRGVLDRQRLWHARRQFRRAQHRQPGPTRACGVRESVRTRAAPRGRGRSSCARPRRTMRQIGAEIGWGQAARREARHLAAMLVRKSKNNARSRP